MYRLAALLLILVLPAAANAATSAWQEVAPGAQLRLISSDVLDAGGQTFIALEVRLQPGLKTYWHVPGETGIPLKLDFSGSTGVAASEIFWPIPMREQVTGYTDHVYYGDTTFPIRLTLDGENPTLNISANMGVCSDICVPVSAQLTLVPDIGARDMSSGLSIRQAMATVPIPWTDPQPPVGNAAYDASTDTLLIEGVSDTLDLASLIASVPGTSIIFAAPQKSPTSGLISFQRLGWGDLTDLTGQTVELIFQSPSGPYLVDRPLVGIDQLTNSD